MFRFILCLRHLICILSMVLYLVPQSCFAQAQNKQIKVGFVMVGSVSDSGYNYAHNLGRLYLQSHLVNVETNVAGKSSRECRGRAGYGKNGRSRRSNNIFYIIRIFRTS